MKKPYTIDPQTVPIKLNNKGLIDLVIAKSEEDMLGRELRRILWEMEKNNISLEELLNRRNTDNE